MPSLTDKELQQIEANLRKISKMKVPEGKDPDKVIIKHVILSANTLADLVKDLRVATKSSLPDPPPSSGRGSRG
jgi:hypothetical protein